MARIMLIDNGIAKNFWAEAVNTAYYLVNRCYKALYGLKQAPRAWYEMLSKFLLENGFKRGKIDNTLFLKKPERNLLIVQGYLEEMEASKVIDTRIAMATRLDMDEVGSPQLEDFGVLTESMPLLYDNTSALNMAKNPVKHKSTNHIDVTHHFLRDNVEKGLICMKFCSTKDQIADIFTKALSREHFERNRVKLGLLKPN
uniref:Uncharacterized protein LOC104242860 n=1 Tax=Nicotiana sylvestris TaxID=4096 RepID=A0A1U7XZG3_NICSY|nr:PREDICTED: uncharacterized protein LOC104242860 [Nicotiana sylvestris]